MRLKLAKIRNSIAQSVRELGYNKNLRKILDVDWDVAEAGRGFDSSQARFFSFKLNKYDIRNTNISCLCAKIFAKFLCL